MYGPDDPLCWLQLFCLEYPHLACVKFAPQNMDPSDPFHSLFAPLTQDLFIVEQTSTVPNVGKLCDAQWIKLQGVCARVINAAQCIEDPPTLKQEILLESEVIRMFLTHLKHLPMNFE